MCLFRRLYHWIIISSLFLSCTATERRDDKTLFRLLPPEKTNIKFANELRHSEEVNTYTFRNFYNGGGVGLGDFDNDGLLDIFLCGNQVSNKLYRNIGNLQFEDITQKAGLESMGIWTTGVSVVDINSDGFLDIYICKSGPPGGERRQNELFINNGDLTFTERAVDFNLDFTGLSIHAAFFDYDNDGDLDCYLLNNSIRSVGGYDLRKDQRNIPDPMGGNKLLRNDNGRFTDVSSDAGIYTSEIGFGLGVTIGDVNQDGWLDIYVSNDFFEKDYLYINQGNGTFSEQLEDYMQEISMGSMGADMADINNDGYPEIFVTEMLPDSDERLKTTSQFESWDKYKIALGQGYYHQFGRNVLQLNNGNNTFSEISRLAGVAATDWSWGALIFDMDNDGWKDIFVANGIYKDLLDQDYVNFVARPDIIREMMRKDRNVITKLVDSIPTNKISNYAFRNTQSLTFENKSLEWGLGQLTHSNGSAYGDLDNDGDLDLVLNNVNMEAYVYENRSNEMLKENRFLSFSLTGDRGNHFALGSTVTLVAGGRRYYQELTPMRGFMSTVDYRLQFGVGEIDHIDSVIIRWPDGRRTVLLNVETNQFIQASQGNAQHSDDLKKLPARPTVLTEAFVEGLVFQHKENDFVDFDRHRLLFNMISTEGPCICKGDINGDGLTDIYIGGSRDQAGALFVQLQTGRFRRMNDHVFEEDKLSEDTACVFFDADGDGSDDLYVGSGGNEFSAQSSALRDRLYLSNGKGVLTRSPHTFPVPTFYQSTSSVRAYDYDRDGDLDLFVGARLVPFLYGVPANGFILNNDGNGNFTDVTKTVAPGLEAIGMITDAKWADINGDSLVDLVVVGEWMPITIFLQENGKLIDRTAAYGLETSQGWYQVVTVSDVNADGRVDIIAGNHGLNSRFKASLHEPVRMYVSDFDNNGTVEHILTRYDQGESYPMVLRNDLVTQIPSLKKKFLRFRSYPRKTIEDIFSADHLSQSIVLKANSLETALWLNDGERFRKAELPVDAQFSPVYAIAVEDFDGDGFVDILLGGNLYRAKPETGIYAASYGTFLKGNGGAKFTAVPAASSGILVRGEVRGFVSLKVGTRNVLVVAKNNDDIDMYEYKKK
jgi:enediyne biosynthesis protein E4